LKSVRIAYPDERSEHGISFRKDSGCGNARIAYRQECRDLGIVSEKEISQQYRKRLSKKAHLTSTSPKAWDVSGSNNFWSRL
jgi:hypothetical protein